MVGDSQISACRAVSWAKLPGFRLGNASTDGPWRKKKNNMYMKTKYGNYKNFKESEELRKQHEASEQEVCRHRENVND